MFDWKLTTRKTWQRSPDNIETKKNSVMGAPLDILGGTALHLYCAGHGEYTNHRPLLGCRRQKLAVSAEADCHHSTAARHHLVENLQIEGIVQNHLLKKGAERNTRRQIGGRGRRTRSNETAEGSFSRTFFTRGASLRALKKQQQQPNKSKPNQTKPNDER